MMKLFRRCTRILIVSLLVVSVFVPIGFLSQRLKHLNSDVSEDFVEDLSKIKHRTEAQALNAIEEDESKGVKEPPLEVFRDELVISAVSFGSTNENNSINDPGHSTDTDSLLETNGTSHEPNKDNHQSQTEKSSMSGEEKHSGPTNVQQDQKAQAHSHKARDEKVKEMRDQVIRAKAYISFAPPTSNSHFIKELRLRIKELERAIGEATKDSDLSRKAFQKMKAMEISLLKASRIYPDCSAMVKKLRAMTHSAEQQVNAQKNQTTFLVQLAGRTTPKGLHCLSMRLTAEYFALQPEERELPNQHKLHDLDLFHFAVFSDNVLACAVVVNSTVSASQEPEKIVIHVVTDSLNFPAMSMWFLLNPPGKATIQVQNMDNFGWLSAKYNATLERQDSRDLRYTSPLNHLRFYLPDVFPLLKKIVLLDHDVVVHKDLTGLWSIDMKGKVNGAVETCQERQPSFRRMDMFINFTDPILGQRFDASACTWAFGMNLFDLQMWKKQNITGVYHKYLHLGSKKPVFRAGSLPIGWLTFYGHTNPLERRWHILGLGYDSGVVLSDIEQGAVLHFDGMMKPWLDVGLEKYKKYWKRYVLYDHPYLQQCNIHP
ncbi:OLC1v1007139C1 [Oldenlandia corymbosa var. corymbosa]|uniref:Hexosyltransferase n=1 Tax=Oldenlandia corymbosa var. corymbosa TaxID=529605 RepID=A0AAV1DIH0_OLDCO|nr:OLC1v1007139C1 [Oldenlandia corymbosa var. corymbosa]